MVQTSFLEVCNYSNVAVQCLIPNNGSGLELECRVWSIPCLNIGSLGGGDIKRTLAVEEQIISYSYFNLCWKTKAFSYSIKVDPITGSISLTTIHLVKVEVRKVSYSWSSHDHHSMSMVKWSKFGCLACIYNNWSVPGSCDYHLWLL